MDHIRQRDAWQPPPPSLTTECVCVFGGGGVCTQRVTLKGERNTARKLLLRNTFSGTYKQITSDKFLHLTSCWWVCLCTWEPLERTRLRTAQLVAFLLGSSAQGSRLGKHVLHVFGSYFFVYARVSIRHLSGTEAPKINLYKLFGGDFLSKAKTRNTRNHMGSAPLRGATRKANSFFHILYCTANERFLLGTALHTNSRLVRKERTQWYSTAHSNQSPSSNLILRKGRMIRCDIRRKCYF